MKIFIIYKRKSLYFYSKMNPYSEKSEKRQRGGV